MHLEARIAPDAVFLGALAAASFASLASTIVPWLLTGGTLVLHHPFAPAVFARQRADERCTVAVLPGPMVMRLADAGLIGARRHRDRAGGLARARAPRAPAPPGRRRPALVDIPVFGEIGLIAARRGAGGKPAALPTGRVIAPRGAAQGVHVLNVARTPTGTVALSGPMVPHALVPARRRARRRAEAQGHRRRRSTPAIRAASIATPSC